MPPTSLPQNQPTPAPTGTGNVVLADGTQLDGGVVKVMRAIRQVESQGNYQAVGDNGSSLGAYQWNNDNTPLKPGELPTHWKSAAQQYLGNPNAPMTPENQNKVAYNQILAYKNEGRTPIEIDALWNGAKKDPNSGLYVHVNPDRLPQFQNALQQQSQGQSQPQGQLGTPQGQPVDPNSVPANDNMPGFPGLLQSLYQTIASPVVNLLARPGQAVQHALGDEQPIEGNIFGGIHVTDPYADVQRGKDPLAAVTSDIGRGIQTVGLGLGAVAGGAAFGGGAALENNDPLLPSLDHPFDNALVQTGVGAGLGKLTDVGVKYVGKGLSLFGEGLATSAAAKTLLDSAAKNWETILAPTTKATKYATAELAPILAKEGEIFTSRGDFLQQATTRADAAGDVIDTIWNSIPDGTTIDAIPVGKYILKSMRELQMKDAAGQTFVPAENQPLYQALDTKIQELLRLTDKNMQVDVNALRAWRQSGDAFIQKSKPFQFAASETDKATVGAAKAATRGARAAINEGIDGVGEANKAFHVWDTAKDVMDATLLRKVGQGTPLSEHINTLGGFFAGSGTVSHAISGALLMKYATKLIRSTLFQSISASLKSKLARAIIANDNNEIVKALLQVMKGGGNVAKVIGDFLQGLPEAAKMLPKTDIPGTTAEDLTKPIGRGTMGTTLKMGETNARDTTNTVGADIPLRGVPGDAIPGGNPPGGSSPGAIIEESRIPGVSTDVGKEIISPPKEGGAATPEKTALTSEFVPPTLGGRIKKAVQNYLENVQPGLSLKDVNAGGQKFNVGLTAVKGKIPSATDALVVEADALQAKGDFKGAQAKYNEALQGGAQVLTDAFNNTGIKIKPSGVGLGIYQEGLEPNFDLTAVVPKGKEDLFHYILADVADTKFHQFSMLTYRQIATDAKLGVTDEARGISQEPFIRITLENPLTGENVTAIQKAAKDSGVQALSVKEGGKVVDIINLSSFNKDYGNFIKQAADFKANLDGQGLPGSLEQRVAEARYVGSDPGQAHGAVSYKQLRDNFRSENPGYFNTEEDFTSKVIEKLKNKQNVSPTELEQLVKSQDITPLERGVVLDALADIKKNDFQRIPINDLVVKIKGKALPVSVRESDQYAAYGVDNVGLDYSPSKGEHPKTLIFETPVEHGDTGHFGSPNHLGHVRTLIMEEDGKKIGYITEIQSDVFQHRSPEELAQRTLSPAANNALDETVSSIRSEYNSQIAEIRHRTELLNEEIGRKSNGFDKADMETISTQAANAEKANEEIRVVMKKRDEAVAQANKDAIGRLDPQAQQFLHLGKNDRYQDTLLRGTLQHFEKQGVDEVRMVTPSSAAKVEGYINDENVAPYRQTNGDPFSRDHEDLSHGDEVEYIGEDYKVVGVGNRDNNIGHGQIVIAPADKVHSFDFNDYVQEEVDNHWSERVVYDLKDRTVGDFTIKDEASLEQLTQEQAQEMLDHAEEVRIKRDAINNKHISVAAKAKQLEKYPREDFDMGDQYLQHLADGLSPEDAKQKMEETFREYADFSNLEDIYGKDKVFSEDISGGRGYNYRIWTVDDDATVEYFNQPSQYESSFGTDNADSIDPSSPKDAAEAKKLIDQNFDKTQATVLKGYVDLYTNNLMKLSKEENIPIEWKTEGNRDSTWYSFPLTKVKHKLFGA